MLAKGVVPYLESVLETSKDEETKREVTQSLSILNTTDNKPASLRSMSSNFSIQKKQKPHASFHSTNIDV